MNNMEPETVILDVTLRSLGEMIKEILQNEGIEAHLIGTSFLSTAYLCDAGLIKPDGVGWRVVVPTEQAKHAREIIKQLEDIGELSFDENSVIDED
ncbi:DUF2007 domain-containing protein [bacterium]|nr:DUF2007 domain-containing protein [bacterium]